MLLIEFLELSSFFSSLILSISMAFFFMMSLVSLILDWMIILWSFSSCDSISKFVLICCKLMCSRCPKEMASSKAKTISKQLSEMDSSSIS